MIYFLKHIGLPGHIILILLVALSTEVKGNDNAVAQHLFDQQRYAEAAEIYTDPAWKGVAFYRSAQWWRAAEAFVRADDADSIFNLGNSYAKLGYFALALEAYQVALSKRPDFEDAQFNLELMRRLLSNDKKEDSESSSTQGGEAIDQIESEDEESGASEAGEENSEDRPDREGDREGDTDKRGPNPDDVSRGKSNDASSVTTLDNEEATEGGAVKGTESKSDPKNNPSGGSESNDPVNSSQAAGLRTKLASEQADEQFLNQISHNPERYLKQRIAAEIKLRALAGDQAPEGGSQW